MQLFVQLEIDSTIYYWTGKYWNNLMSTAKDYKTKGNANRAAKMLARYYNGTIETVAVKLPLFELGEK